MFLFIPIIEVNFSWFSCQAFVLKKFGRAQHMIKLHLIRFEKVFKIIILESFFFQNTLQVYHLIYVSAFDWLIVYWSLIKNQWEQTTNTRPTNVSNCFCFLSSWICVKLKENHTNMIHLSNGLINSIHPQSV